MFLDIAIGLCISCGQVSHQAKKYQNGLLRHKNGEMWGCPYCNDVRYFLMPKPKYTPARDYLDALAEAMATWPNGEFKRAKEIVEKCGGW